MPITTYPQQIQQSQGSLLGQAQVTATQTVGATATDLAGLSVTVTVPAGRTIMITGYAFGYHNSVANAQIALSIYEGATQLQGTDSLHGVAGNGQGWGPVSCIISPTAGTHTYKLSAMVTIGGGTATMSVSATRPAYITVEDITGFQNPYGGQAVAVGLLAQTQYTANSAAAAGLNNVLSATVTVPSGRTLLVRFETYMQNSSPGAAAGGRVGIYMDNTAAAGIGQTGQIQQSDMRLTAANVPEKFACEVLISPSAGSHTFSVNLDNGGTGNITSVAGAGYPTQLQIIDVTATPAPANSAPSSMLGYAEVNGNQSGITAEVDLTGLSVTVTVPTGRRIRITGRGRWQTDTAAAGVLVAIYEDDSMVQQYAMKTPYNNLSQDFHVETVRAPASGAHTYKLRMSQYTTGTVLLGASSTIPASITVEDITPSSTQSYSILPSTIQPGSFLAGTYFFPSPVVIGSGTDALTSGAVAQLVGAASANQDNVAMKKVGAISATNIYWSISHRSDNKSLLIYGYDGTNFKNFAFFDWTNSVTEFDQSIYVNGPAFPIYLNNAKTAYLQSNGLLHGTYGTGGGALKTRAGGNDVSFDWGAPFSIYVDVTNVKTFVIPHPTDNERYLIHACAEGPENVVFYRGQAALENGAVVIELPAYFEALCAEEGRSVQLTPIADDPHDEWCPVLHATYPQDGKFWVGLGSGMVIPDQRFWWEVKAVRKDVAPLNVEPLTDTVDVLGSGPYTYYKEK